MRIGFISISLLKARVLNLKISKICLVLPESLSAVKICCILSSDSEANRDGSDAESLFPLFFSLLRTLAREQRWENCPRWPSLCLYLLFSQNIIFYPALTMAARAKKNSG